MANYDELARYVMDWSNRSTEVLSYNTIKQCVNYAHDEIYRTLRIAPLEFTGETTIDETAQEQGYLITPEDLVEFIQLRKDRNFGSDLNVSDKFDVAEAKSDLRSMLGDNLTLYSDYAYVREGTSIWVYPRLTVGEKWYLHYYRRLPAPNERWTLDEWLDAFNLTSESTALSATALNAFLEQYTHQYSTNATETGFIPVSFEDVVTDELIGETDTRIPFITGNAIAAALPNVPAADFMVGSGNDAYSITSRTYYGQLKAQWLRDENEKILLFGALYHAFDYLDEPEQVGKFKGKFEQEIAKLNEEERLRQHSGGNINVNFYNPLI